MSTTHCLAGLKSARLRAGIKPEACAEVIGVNVRTYYRYEAGARRIYFDKACVLADTIGCTLDELRHDPDDGTVVQNALAGWDVEPS